LVVEVVVDQESVVAAAVVVSVLAQINR